MSYPIAVGVSVFSAIGALFMFSLGLCYRSGFEQFFHNMDKEKAPYYARVCIMSSIIYLIGFIFGISQMYFNMGGEDIEKKKTKKNLSKRF